METKQIEIGAEDAGGRLDRVLATRLGVSRARVRHLIEHGRVAKGDRALEIGDKSARVEAREVYAVAGPLRAEEEIPEPNPDWPLRVLAEGPGWLVIDKPVGCGVHPLHPDQHDTALGGVLASHPEILGVGEGGLRSGVVHRLDVGTSGTLLFATDDDAWRRLRGAFSEHRVVKRYLAIVAGHWQAPQRIRCELAVTQHRPARVRVVESGGHAVRQRVRPRARLEGASLVEVELETGFLHQIRATLAHAGHPLLGDEAYGGPPGPEVDGRRGPWLHAIRLAVDEINACAPMPEAFHEALVALGGEASEWAADRAPGRLTSTE